MAEHEYKKRLCDLVNLEENSRDCVILTVKPEVKPMDLIRLGGFDGTETMFRVSKEQSSATISVFREGQPAYHMERGTVNTRVSSERNVVRDLVAECVNLDFGVFTHGAVSMPEFDSLAGKTSGQRDLNSPRHITVQRVRDYAALLVNHQFIGGFEDGSLERWLAERNARMDVREVEHRSGVDIETGYLDRVYIPELNEIDKPLGEPLSDQDRFDQAIDETLGAFLNKTGWKDLDATAAVKEFARFAKQESPFFNQSLESAMETAKGRAAEKNANRPDKGHTRKAPEQDR